MNISAEPSAPPQTNVDEEMVEKIKVAMSDRYVPENKGRKSEHMSYDSSIFTIHTLTCFEKDKSYLLIFSSQSQSVSCRPKISWRVLLCAIKQVYSNEKSC